MSGSASDSPYAGHVPPRISILSIDTLEHAFLFCMTLPGSVTTEQRYSSFAISHVCRFWRAIALNSGRLWTNIDIGNSYISRLYLQRAQESALHLRIFPDVKQKTVAAETAAALRRHIVRVESVDLNHQVGEIRTFFRAVGRNLTSLRALHLRNSFGTSRGASTLYLEVRAPCLRELTLVYVLLVPVGVPRADSFDFARRDMSVIASDLRDLLRGSPALERLQFTSVEFMSGLEFIVPGRDDLDAPIYLPQLRYCEFERCSSIHYVLNALQIPEDVQLKTRDSTPTLLSTSLPTSGSKSLSMSLPRRAIGRSA